MKTQRGFSLIELLIVVAIILAIAAIAVPNLLRSRMSANQAAAVSNLRNINNSQAAYIAQFGNGIGYASDFVKLGPGVPCDENHACLVDSVIGCLTQPCVKSGYGYFLTTVAQTAPFLDYSASATPVLAGSSGANNYCSTDDGVLREQVATATLTTAVLRSGCADSKQFTPLH